MIKVVSPNYGLDPRYYDEILGKKINVDLKKFSPLKQVQKPYMGPEYYARRDRLKPNGDCMSLNCNERKANLKMSTCILTP